MKALPTNYFDVAQTLTYQKLLTNPIMDIAARFWEKERYVAAKICYRAMRIVDDLIDNHKAVTQCISKGEKQKLSTLVNDWAETINGTRPCDSNQKQLVETITRFQIPLWPWHKFSQSMLYDIHHDGFRTLPIFLKYAEGAAVAPASIYLHLCSIVKTNGRYNPPLFDIRKITRPAARFCYLVHIIRDFQKDQFNNLNYFADNLMAKNGLNHLQLREIADGGEIPPGFRNLMKEYYNLADFYRRETKQMIEKIGFYLEPRYTLSLVIVYKLYLQIFERIDVSHGNFTSAELTPSPKEIQKRLNRIIASYISNKTKILSFDQL